MAKVSELFPRKWLRADDLQGRAVRVFIDSVAVESLFNPRSRKSEPRIVVAFHGKQRRLVLNKTQARALAAIAGDDTDGWAGHEVVISAALAPNGQGTIAISAVPQNQERNEQ